MKKFNPKSIIRPAIQLVVGVTTYAVANAVIKNNTADPETNAQKATLATGSFVLAHLVSSSAVKYVDARIDSAIQDVKDSKTERDQKNQK